MGPGSWARGCREYAHALEATLGIALVRPAHHHALTSSGFAVRGPILALRVSWDSRGATTFEWFGAACPDVSRSPQSRAWGLVITAGGSPIFRSADATSVDAADSLARAVGDDGAEHPYPALLLVRWAARKDGHAVDITLTSGGIPPLHVSIAPKF